MQVSVETTQGLERRMTVVLPEDEVKEEIGKRLKDMVKKAKINGFRPGKVPLSLIKKRYGTGVRREVMGERVQTSFQQALEQEKLRVAGNPTIDLQEDKESFGFTAIFEVYPDVKPAELTGVTIEKWVSEVTQQDVDNMLLRLRKNKATWKIVERAAVLGDQVEMDYKGTVDGEPFDGGEATGSKVELGAKQLIAGFEDNLVGQSAGDQVEMDLTFPDGYQSKQLAGKPAHFSVMVKQVYEIVLPDVDAAFIEQLGVKGDESDFMQEIKANLSRELVQKLGESNKQRVMDVLVEKNPIEIPKGLQDMEIDALAAQMRTRVGITQDTQIPRELFVEQARRRVIIGLVLAEIVHENNLQVDSEKVREKIERMAENYEDPQVMVDRYYKDEEQRRNVETLVLEDQVVDWVMEQATITEKTVDFNEVVTPA